MRTSYIFVAGGVMSGVGKGTAVASLGLLLQSRGLSVTAVKADPYLNEDAGTMNPLEHGEVFVTDDGDETDQDIGSYERFLNTSLSSDNYMTLGRVLATINRKERRGDFLGKCVEVVPDVPNEIIRRIEGAARKTNAQVVIIEIGGTVGELQNVLFLEAARMMKLHHPRNVAFVLVSYLPVPPSIGEMKTKPTQTAVHSLSAAGIQADFLLARSEVPFDEQRRAKMAMLCNIAPENIILSPNVNTVYRVPLVYNDQRLAEKVMARLGLKGTTNTFYAWEKWANSIREFRHTLPIGIVGKYFSTGDFSLPDVYFSVIEALKHACWAMRRRPELHWLNAEEYEDKPTRLRKLRELAGVVVPGGFGKRGVEGKIAAIQYLREHKIPFLGLCYGMQIAVIEFARHVCRLEGANTTEIDQRTKYPVIDLMRDQQDNVVGGHLGGTMRLGSYPCVVARGTKLAQAYGSTPIIHERHRHRYEFNNRFRDTLVDAGLVLSGISPDEKLVEAIELPDHPFFVAAQFHPELLTRPMRPHPLFRTFVRTAIKRGKR